MDTLQTLMGKDLKSAIASLEVVQGTARDSGNVYYALEIKFVNGYSKRIFPNDAERFAIANAVSLTQTTQQVPLASAGEPQPF